MKASLQEIGKVLGQTIESDRFIDTLLTDSRNMFDPETTLFFAISTPGGNDGHNYIDELYKRGVRQFVVEIIPDKLKNLKDVVFIKVANTREALLKVGKLHKSTVRERVAIVGSYGKTLLKEWLFQLSEPFFKVSRSPRSFNSQIGVPLSLWQSEPNDDIIFIEAGISQKGEMRILADCIDPTTVIFTNIGDAHSEGFDSIREKGIEKTLIAGKDSVKRMLYNSDDELLDELLKPYATEKKIYRWSLNDRSADLYIPDIRRFPTDDVTYYFQGSPYKVKTRLTHTYDVSNLAASLLFMHLEGVSANDIANRVPSLYGIKTRLNVVAGDNGCSVINDSFTADSANLRQSIDFMLRRKTSGQRSVIIMSDIDTGCKKTDKVYSEIAGMIKLAGIDHFIGIGRVFWDNRGLFGSNSEFYRTPDDFLAQYEPYDYQDSILLLKGSPGYDFRKINDALQQKRHETVLEVNLDALTRNYNYFRSKLKPGVGIVAMVKASGYGAGSFEIARTMQDCGAAYLAVAVIDEGVELRESGIRMPIMVMNPRVANYEAMFNHNLEPEIYSFEMLDTIIAAAKETGIKDYPVHIKLDTGMHRTGFIEEEIEQLAHRLKQSNEVRLSSVFSHLATADCPDMNDYTYFQFRKFEQMTSDLSAMVKTPFKKHILNSAGILRFPEYQFDMVRLGIGLYGANTLPPEMEEPLSVVSSLKTVIISIRDRKAGDTIGYGRRGEVTKDSRIATIPIGYADGMNRHFGRGRISVKVNGKDAPTIGNICMDACMIDVTGIDCKVGDSVEVFGNEAPLQRLADELDTIPYEILTSVSPRVKRVYYRE